MESMFSESIRQKKPWSAKPVYSTLFAPDMSWDNLHSSSAPHRVHVHLVQKLYCFIECNVLDLILRALSSTIKYFKYLISEEKI
jgi:hypothetical protein